MLIDAYLPSKATSGAFAAVNRTEGRNQQQQSKNKQGGQKISDAEKKRQNAMKGKCFRCGSRHHMTNNCRVAKDLKCHSCGAQGHIQSACGTGKARATEEAPRMAMVQGHNFWPTPPLFL